MPSVEFVGKQLFGRPLRLRVLIWVMNRSDPFCKSEASKGVGYSSTTAVIAELSRLEALGMIEAVKPVVTSRRHDYKKVDHPFWDPVRAIATSAIVTTDKPKRASAGRRRPET